MFVFDNIDKTWIEFLEDKNIKEELKNIFNSIGTPIYKNKSQVNYYNIEDCFFPYVEDVFKFMKININTIKYIILGMDPYSSYYIDNGKIIPIATGRSFEVSNIESWATKIKQVSLVNILKTLYYDKFEKIEDVTTIRNSLIEFENIEMYKEYKDYKKTDKIKLLKLHKWFDYLEEQGVLWLNATLTVRANMSGSHMKIWNYFMNSVINYIKSINDDIKYVSFGSDAINRITGLVEEKKIIKACHPASRQNNTFIVDDIFNKMSDIEFYK